MEKLEKLMNIDEVAEYLGVTKTTIYSWTAQKKIPHIKLTRKLLKFREKDIMDWLAQKSVSADASEVGQRKRLYSRPSSNLSNDSIQRIIRNAKAEVLGR